MPNFTDPARTGELQCRFKGEFMEKNFRQIKKLAEDKDEENWEFRCFSMRARSTKNLPRPHPISISIGCSFPNNSR